MFKKTIAIFLLLVFFCQSFNRLVVYVSFYANQHYIAENLCENRDNPMMHCNGHCQLNKKLADDNKQNSQVPIQKYANEMGSFFIYLGTVRQTVFIEKVAKPFCDVYRSLHPQTFIHNSFRPPTV